jgi:hypothetical protein
MATKNRSDLKSYFVKNAIPTESNFADLVDSQLNQAQDGVFKPDGEALSVVAAHGDQKRVLRLYASYPAASPDWMISLHPAQDPANAATTGKTGFGITDGAGKPRLFIDATTGQIGMGTNTPQFALDVVGSVQANGFRGRYDLVLNDYRTVNPAFNTCLQSPANDRDAWIYRDPNDAASNWGIYHRQIDTAVGGLPGNSIGFVGGSSSKLQAYVNLGDGSGFFAGGVSIQGAMDVSATSTTWGGWYESLRFTRSEHAAITHPGGKLLFGMHGNRNFYFTDTNAGRHVMTISGVSGNVDILGALTVGGALTPSAGNSENNGILFPKDPGGGGSDRAFIRYFAESGETTKLLIGTSDNADDRVSLYQYGAERLIIYNGCVGINNSWPSYTLHVSGSFAATNKYFCIDNPVDARRALVHSVLEGPEVAVFYRGEAVLVDGACEIGLPSYFEALTRKDNRTVLVTPKLSEGEETSALAASGVADGRFIVRSIDPRNRKQRFFWEVKGVRADVAPLEVEPMKPDVPAPPPQLSPLNLAPATTA